MNKYSVLMSVYKNDNPKFLNLALQSIYDNQTRKPDEIVVVFDGPLTDELNSVLNTFKKGKEKVVKYYPQKENKGLGEALRIGVKKCSGNYIFRMDSDDISKNDRFEKQIKFIENHPEIDVVGGIIEEFNQSPKEKDLRKRICPKNHNDIVEMGKKRNPMNHVTVCMKKKSVERAGNYKTLLYLEDYYLWLRMIIAGFKLANIEETLVYVRVGNGFETRRGNKKQIEGWKVLQNYMLENKLITRLQSIENMIYIRLFVYMPKGLKKILYTKLLRK